MASPSPSRWRVVSFAGTLIPERKERVERQLLFGVDDVEDDSPSVTLSAELQEELVKLMAEAIAAVLARDGGDDE
jgi:hypothetical protein